MVSTAPQCPLLTCGIDPRLLTAHPRDPVVRNDLVCVIACVLVRLYQQHPPPLHLCSTICVISVLCQSLFAVSRVGCLTEGRFLCVRASKVNSVQRCSTTSVLSHPQRGTKSTHHVKTEPHPLLSHPVDTASLRTIREYMHPFLIHETQHPPMKCSHGTAQTILT